jgi:hypothetical protein
MKRGVNFEAKSNEEARSIDHMYIGIYHVEQFISAESPVNQRR